MAWYGAFQLEFIDPDCRCIHLAITALFIMPKWIIPCSARGCNFCLCCYFVPSTFFLSAPPSVLQIFRSTCVVIVVAPDGKYLHERTLWQQRPTAASCVRHHCIVYLIQWLLYRLKGKMSSMETSCARY